MWELSSRVSLHLRVFEFAFEGLWVWIVLLRLQLKVFDFIGYWFIVYWFEFVLASLSLRVFEFAYVNLWIWIWTCEFSFERFWICICTCDLTCDICSVQVCICRFLSLKVYGFEFVLASLGFRVFELALVSLLIWICEFMFMSFWSLNLYMRVYIWEILNSRLFA